LGEATKIMSGSTPSTKNGSYRDGNIVRITPKDLSSHNSVYITKGERNITKE
jgi:type I restriction enzyme S subunit